MIDIDRINEYRDLCQMLDMTPQHPSNSQMSQLIDEMMIAARRTPGTPYYLCW